MCAIINNVQIITKDGGPFLVVIPHNYFLKLTGDEDTVPIPYEVTGLDIKNNWNLVKAWSKNLKMSKKVIAERAGITQPALSRVESSENLRDNTIDKLATAMGIKLEQLID
jgi:predicted XRE-type DNA-binding protein